MYLGVVYDAMREIGYRDQDFFINIKPKAGYSGLICGPALTTFGRPVDASEEYSVLDNIRLDIYKKHLFANKPIVLLQANDSYCAHSGDITSLIYKTLGAKGFITDGNVRDLDQIDTMNFPCFCVDSNPIDALDYWALTSFNTAIEIKGVKIEAGDMIYASLDGVIRVPLSEYENFLAVVADVTNKEDKIRDVIMRNKDSVDFTEQFTQFVKSNGRW